MSNLTLVFCFEFERFPSVECDWNIKISRNVQILGFWKKMIFFLKTYMITVNVKAFVIKWIARKQLLEIFKGAFIELSNLRRKFAMSTNIDSWFTYCVLSQQNSVSVEFVLWTLWFRKFSVWQSKIAATPPPLSFTTPNNHLHWSVTGSNFRSWAVGTKRNATLQHLRW